MRKRFIVALDSNTKQQDELFREYIKKEGLGWWHWISNFWLLTDSQGRLTAGDLRDALGTIYPGVRRFVIEIDEEDDTWSGYGPKSKGKNMFDWLRKNWW